MGLFGSSNKAQPTPTVDGEAGIRIDLAGQLAARRSAAQTELSNLHPPHLNGGSRPADRDRIAQLQAEIKQIDAERAKL